MPYVNRNNNDTVNPTLPGGNYGKYITIGRPVYYRFDGTRTRFIIFISDGGLYGLDRITTFEFKGIAFNPADYIFHRGTLTKQIQPKQVINVNAATNILTSVAHGYANDTPVRMSSTQSVPAGIVAKAKYFIANAATDTFQVKDESGTIIDLTSGGAGSITVWKANTGFDDPEQGLPFYCPEVNNCFSNIAYIEGILPEGESEAGTQPEWEKFRIIGVGRRLMDYDTNGANLGVISNNDELLSNVALQVADNLLNSYKVKPTRINFPSLFVFKQASAVKLLQSAPENPNQTASAYFFTGYYYGDDKFDNLVATRLDQYIDFAFGTTAPVLGQPATYYSIKWLGQIRPQYTETYTFNAYADDNFVLMINGQPMLYVEAATNPNGSVQMSLVANQIYDLEVRFKNYAGNGGVTLEWQSSSQGLENIGAVASEIAQAVNRYGNHSAVASPIEASEYHERLMERAPGYDWTDSDGQIYFLSPERGTAFEFKYDAIDDDSSANFLLGSFTKKRRSISERKNYQIFRYRNVLITGFPENFVTVDREQTRRFNNSVPTNEAADDLGVATRSLAQRMGEVELTLKSDPKFIANIAGARRSGKIRKNQFVNVIYYDLDNNYVVDESFLITLHSWGSSAGENQFSILPVPNPYYKDAATIVLPEESPIDLLALFDELEPPNVNLTWNNRNARGNNIILRKRGSGTFSQIASLGFSESEYIDSSITVNGDYTYRLYNANIPDEYVDYTVTVDLGDDAEPSALAPDNLEASFDSPNVLVTWDNHGAGGSNVLYRKPAGGSYSTALATLSSSVDEFIDTTIPNDGTYFYKVVNTAVVGDDETSITVDLPDAPGGGTPPEIGAPPTNLNAPCDNFGYVSCSWNNHGATGSNILSYKPSGSLGAFTDADFQPFNATTGGFYLPSYGSYTIQVRNSSVSGYSQTETEWIDGFGGGLG